MTDYTTAPCTCKNGIIIQMTTPHQINLTQLQHQLKMSQLYILKNNGKYKQLVCKNFKLNKYSQLCVCVPFSLLFIMLI